MADILYCLTNRETIVLSGFGTHTYAGKVYLDTMAGEYTKGAGDLEKGTLVDVQREAQDARAEPIQAIFWIYRRVCFQFVSRCVRQWRSSY